MINSKNLDATAISYKDERISYRKLLQYVQNFSEIIALKDAKVAIYAENSLEWVYSLYASWLNSCIVVPIEAGAAVEDVEYILNDCKPDILFTTKELYGKLVDANVQNIPPHKYFSDLRYKHNVEKIASSLNNPEDKTAVIIYTSGTTGKPKGVMLSFRNLITNIKAVTEQVEIMTKDRGVLLLLPLHHVLPLVGALCSPLYIGGTVVMVHSMQSKHILETLKTNKVNVIIGVPRFYELIYINLKSKIFASKIGKLLFGLAKKINSYSFSKKIFKKAHVGLGGHVEYMVCGGAALNNEVGSFYKTLGFEVLEGYGMTEAAPMISFTRPGRVLVGSPGELLDGIELKTIDNEIVVRGDNVMKGYYNKPKETAETLKDGWLYTGDLGYLDKNNFLHITGRKKDLIVLPNGKNISPVELEIKLENSDVAIKEAAIFMDNNKLHALILPDFEYLYSQDITDLQSYFQDEVLNNFNKNLSSYKRVLQFTLIKEPLPRTRLGKIQRFKLANFVEKPKTKKDENENQYEEYKVIKEFIEHETDTKISLHDHIEYDIALDSLGKLSLIDFIERTFGVSIDEDKLISFPSVKSMVEHIRNNKIWHKIENTNWTETLKEKVNLKLPQSWFTLTIMKNSAKAFFKLYFNFKGEGYKYLPKNPCIIAPNHQSFFDGLFVASFIGRKTLKSTYFYAKKKHVNNKFLTFLAKRNNVIVVDLKAGLKESIQQMAEVLKKGKNIIIFPEGTRTENGELGEFKKMFAILSKELNVPVVPVAISGAFKALPRGSKFPRPFTKIKVRFLEAVYPQNYTQDGLVEAVYKIIKQNLVPL